MKLNYSKLNFINHELFSEQYIKNMRKIIENNVHEKYIEESPSDIFSFIRTIINSNYARIDSNAQNQLSDNYQKIIFESMQTYLRYLTEDYTLK